MKIRNKQTGQIIEVPDNELPKYGITATTAEPAQTTQPTQTQATQPSSGGLTAEMAALSQILLPSDKAFKIKSAYDIQQAQQKTQQTQLEKQQAEQQKIVEENQKKLNAVKPIQGVLDTLDKLEKQAKETTLIDKLNPLSSKIQQFNTTKQLATQFLAKAVQEGKLSDKDIEVFSNKINTITPFGFDSPKKQEIANLKRDVITLTGVDESLLKKKDSQIATGLEDVLQPQTQEPQQQTEQPQQDIQKGFLNRLINPQDKQGIGADVLSLNDKINNSISQKLGVPFETLRQRAIGPAVSFLYPKSFDVQNRLDSGENVPTSDIDSAAKEIGGSILLDLVTAGAFRLGGPVAKKAFSKFVSGPTAGLVEKFIASKPAVKAYVGAFTVPSKIEPKMKMLETAEEMLSHNVTGSLQDISAKANMVTGDTGLLTKLTRKAIGTAKTEVDINNILGPVKNLLSKSLAIPQKERSQILMDISSNLPVGKKIGFANSMDVFDTVKQLEKQGHQFLDSSTYLTKNLKNEQIGNVLLGAADEMKLAIEKTMKQEDILKKVITPDDITQAMQISSKLGKQLSEVKTIADLRKLQAPFVRVGRMVDLTEQSAQSTFNKLSTGVSKVGTRAVSGGIGGAIAGIPGLIAGIGVDILAGSPTIKTKGAKVLENLLSKQTPSIPTAAIGTGVKNTSRGLAQIMRILLAKDELNSRNQNQ